MFWQSTLVKIKIVLSRFFCGAFYCKLSSISPMYFGFWLNPKSFDLKCFLHQGSKQSQGWVCQQNELIFALYVQHTNFRRYTLPPHSAATIENQFRKVSIPWSSSIAHISNYNRFIEFWNGIVRSMKFIDKKGTIGLIQNRQKVHIELLQACIADPEINDPYFWKRGFITLPWTRILKIKKLNFSAQLWIEEGKVKNEHIA